MKWETYADCDIDTLRRTINFSTDKVKTLKKKHSKNLHEYLESLCTPLESIVSYMSYQHQNSERTIADKTKEVVLENRALERNCEALLEDNADLKCEVECMKEKLEQAIQFLE